MRIGLDETIIVFEGIWSYSELTDNDFFSLDVGKTKRGIRLLGSIHTYSIRLTMCNCDINTADSEAIPAYRDYIFVAGSMVDR